MKIYAALVVLCFLFVFTQGQKLAPWPKSFSVPYNATNVEAQIFGTPGMLYFDYTRQAQTLTFFQCAPAGNDKPCTLIFNATKTFLIFNSGRSCCVAFADVGTLPPQWTDIMEFNRTTWAYGHKVDIFSGGGHDYYLNLADQHAPVLIMPEFLAFTAPFSVGPQHASLFELPLSCSTAVACPAPLQKPVMDFRGHH
eukprot:TRINITY_DN1662_c0_g1_i2.p1 TRINITY_DN1662_c0_g1~~TRINITY_DN1662_c0_g1_i2.p1  ORF type:complete len:196 (-),score=30.71 TRINITY_DN1662_c0_g1_i2:127-714(-)